ncbi:Peptidase M8 [Trypanosoma melophagium]|uniref:Peptidase M8 n=1 Tax=Trypanosoma melophagium TaxID=715481 RepID=UPI00351A4D11|nr:Peptidase M8 [Trypanosoma melophagium]
MTQQAYKLSARTPATVRRPLSVMPLLLLLLFMCCASVCVAWDDGVQRCMFEEMINKSGVQSTGVFRELPRKGQSGLQAYIVATRERNGEKDKEWELIRIVASTDDLENSSRYCTAKGEYVMDFKGGASICYDRDIFTEEMKKTLINELIPTAIKLHRDRLRVIPQEGNLIVPQFEENSYCKYFTVPDEHRREGVANADFVIYVAAGTRDPFGVTCAPAKASDRPIAGAMNFPPYYIIDPRWSVRIAAREIAHALGFDYKRMKELKMVTTVSNLRGKDRELVTSTLTAEKAQKHYGCSDLKGMELEEDETGSGETSSQWTRRNAKDELMAPTNALGGGYYTALTMATFEDLGYYKANWGMEEPMKWGNNSGCDFFEDFCMVENASTHPEMFCDKAVSRCTTDRNTYGTCNLPTGTDWENEKDSCPFATPFSVRTASGVNRIHFCFSDNIPVHDGSLTGKNSWCLDGDSLNVRVSENTVKHNVSGVCALVLCDESNRKVQVMYNGSLDWHDCPKGTSIEVKSSTFESGKIKCPEYSEVCTVAPDGSSRVRVSNSPDDQPSSPGDSSSSSSSSSGDHADNVGGGGNDNVVGGCNVCGCGDGCATVAPIALAAVFLMVITPML